MSSMSKSKHIYIGKCQLLQSLCEVIVPLLYFLLTCSEVRAEEDHGGGFVGDADGDGSLVSRGSTHPSLDVFNTNISGRKG